LQKSPSSARDGALVIGDGYAPLAVARSLGRRGIPVWVASGPLRLATSSRYVHGCIPWPVSSAPEVRAQHLVEVAHRNHLEGWTLFAGSDAAAELIALHRKMLSDVFRIASSSIDAVRDALDKRRTYALAERVGVEHPRTLYPQNADELMRLQIDYPAIVKPAIKIGWNAFIKAKAWKVPDRDQLMRRYKEARSMVEPHSIMVQDVIPGSNQNQFSYAALCRDGIPLAGLVARRLRQYPVEFGRASSMVETIDLPEVESVARRMLKAMEFTGLVEVEFKRDPRDGKLKLLDINPRTWRWLSLGQRAGVDFPYLMYRLARGEKIDPIQGAVGVRWVRMSTDVLAAALEIWRGTASWRGYLGSLRPPLEFAILALDDLRPALLEVPHLIASDIRRLRLASRFRRAD